MFLFTFLAAMAVEEGFFKPNSRPERNNNPLDLIWCQETAHFGATGGDPKFAIFPDAATGWSAAKKWLSVPARFDKDGNLIGGYLGATIEQVIRRFAPVADGNNTEAYIDGVCRNTGLSGTAILTLDLLVLPS